MVPEQYKRAESELDILINEFWTPSTQKWEYYITLLQQIKQSLGERDEVNSSLIQLRELIETTPDLLSNELTQRTFDLVESLWGEIVIESFGWSEYATAKSNIISLLNEPFKQQSIELFQQFEQVQDDQEQSKMILDKIFTLAGEARDQWVNDVVDFSYIQASLCNIIVYFELPSQTCGTSIGDDTTDDNTDTWDDTWSEWRSVVSTILRRVIWIVIVLAIWIWVMILIFAIKARRRQQEDEADEV
jgi:hypothetical protein